jgi:hypothetical protein
MADQRDLVRALVELSDTNHLYVRNAQYRASVDALASMLPSMLLGLAQGAEKAQAEHERWVSIYERMPTKMLLKDLGLTPEQLAQSTQLLSKIEHPARPQVTDVHLLDD